MLGHECHDGAWVTVLQVVGDDQPRTRSHRCQILPTGDVEAEGRQRQQYIRFCKRHGVVGGSKQRFQVCARDQHALRRSGGPGGEQDVGRGIGRNALRRWKVNLGCFADYRRRVITDRHQRYRIRNLKTCCVAA